MDDYMEPKKKVQLKDYQPKEKLKRLSPQEAHTKERNRVDDELEKKKKEQRDGDKKNTTQSSAARDEPNVFKRIAKFYGGTW